MVDTTPGPEDRDRLYRHFGVTTPGHGAPVDRAPRPRARGATLVPEVSHRRIFGAFTRTREALSQPVNRLSDVAPRVDSEHIAALDCDFGLFTDIMHCVRPEMPDQILRDLFEDRYVVTVQGR